MGVSEDRKRQNLITCPLKKAIWCIAHIQTNPHTTLLQMIPASSHLHHIPVLSPIYYILNSSQSLLLMILFHSAQAHRNLILLDISTFPFYILILLVEPPFIVGTTQYLQHRYPILSCLVFEPPLASIHYIVITCIKCIYQPLSVIDSYNTIALQLYYS